MKIFRITPGNNESTKYCEPHIFENSDWNNNSFFMNRCEKKYELPVPYYVTNKIPPEDFPISHSFLVSNKFLDLIKHFNKQIEFYKSDLFYQKKDKIWDSYYTTIYPEFSLLDFENSDCKYEINKTTGNKNIWLLKKIVLKKTAVEQLNSDNNFFCLSEMPTKLLCTETAKNAIEEAELTGIGFEELEVI